MLRPKSPLVERCTHLYVLSAYGGRNEERERERERESFEFCRAFYCATKQVLEVLFLKARDEMPIKQRTCV